MTIIYIYIHVQNAFQITFVPLMVINLHLPVMYIFQLMAVRLRRIHVVASELKDPICHSNECQIGSFSSEATMYAFILLTN